MNLIEQLDQDVHACLSAERGREAEHLDRVLRGLSSLGSAQPRLGDCLPRRMLQSSFVLGRWKEQQRVHGSRGLVTVSAWLLATHAVLCHGQSLLPSPSTLSEDEHISLSLALSLNPFDKLPPLACLFVRLWISAARTSHDGRLALSQAEEAIVASAQCATCADVLRSFLAQRATESIERERDKEVDRETQCVVCLDRYATIRLSPCRHRSLCRPCALTWIRTEQAGADAAVTGGSTVGGGCPLCRAQVVEWTKEL